MEVKRLFVSKKNGKGVSERRHLLTKKKKKRKPNSHQPKMFDLKKILRGGLLGMDIQISLASALQYTLSVAYLHTNIFAYQAKQIKMCIVNLV
jgi:hypothetical protein